MSITMNNKVSENFEVIPKVALNDANLVIKLKSPMNLLSKMGKIEHYKVRFFEIYIKIKSKKK